MAWFLISDPYLQEQKNQTSEAGECPAKYNTPEDPSTAVRVLLGPSSQECPVSAAPCLPVQMALRPLCLRCSIVEHLTWVLTVLLWFRTCSAVLFAEMAQRSFRLKSGHLAVQPSLEGLGLIA
ncbi:hypothetical protein P7K49_040670 [Saguinus oedipus]|uniref:Uncharacterized protein n=1 Tax=Saguinus oedipus TaxID=9490 RepID=A0ABQ9T961_SAGOE|nr:hypothetical protein P7K49_040670 [Saguinus oedipus]